ncbi:MAG: tRNA (adenosine(37)-N6)-threonylcarbamoyltransferase complex ATPase subunit type 1 TsaE [Pseudomonas marincola]
MTPILQVSVANENETAALAKSLGAILKAQDIVTLNGTLGAGKTAFARALIRGLCGETTEVPSPTFNLLLTYDCERAPIYHYDFYRLEDPEEVWELDIEEAYDTGITLIEWVSNLQDLAPETSLDITLSIPEGGDEGTRLITVTGPEDWQDRLKNLTD